MGQDDPRSTGQDFYKTLRAKLDRWAAKHRRWRWVEYVLLAPDFFHLLVKMTLDPEVPAGKKAQIVALVGYFVAPMDVVPEGVVGPAGYVDDVALTAWVLNSMIGDESLRAIVERHWAGRESVREAIRRVLAMADQMVGSGLWELLKRRFGQGRA